MALFSKRHYQFLANVLLEYKPNGKELAAYHKMFVNYLAKSLKQDNKLFDMEKFVTATGANREYAE